MNQKVQKLVRTYAQAYINAFGDELSLDDIAAIKKAQSFLVKNKTIRALLKFPETKRAAKLNFFMEFCNQFGLVPSLYKLMNLLVEHKRSFLIAPALRLVSSLYEEQYGVLSFSIVSSHSLDTTTLQRVEKFLETKTGKRIVYTHKVDKKLIAGMRLQSSSLLWEYSVAKKLTSITNYLSAEG